MRIPKSGVYNAYILDGSGGSVEAGESITADQLAWFDLDYTNEDVQNWLKNESDIPEIVCDAMLATETRPRLATFDEGVLLILRGVNLNPGADPDDMISLRLWISHRSVITTRMRNLFSVSDMKQDLQQKRGPRTIHEFVIQILYLLVRRMGETIDNFEEVLSEIESKLISGEINDLRSELAILRKQTIELRRFFTPQRDALSELRLKNPLGFDANNLRMLQEIREQLMRHIEDLDAVFGRSAITYEELQSHTSGNMNKRLYILSLITAIFLPLGFLTGLLGVNIAGIPGAEYPYAFPVFVIAMLLIVLIQILIFKTRKWF